MSHSVILACEMIEDEVGLALQSLPADERPPIVWVESGLHDHPERLNAALQDSGGPTGRGLASPDRCGTTFGRPRLRPGA